MALDDFVIEASANISAENGEYNTWSTTSVKEPSFKSKEVSVPRAESQISSSTVSTESNRGDHEQKNIQSTPISSRGIDPVENNGDNKGQNNIEPTPTPSTVTYTPENNSDNNGQTQSQSISISTNGADTPDNNSDGNGQNKHRPSSKPPQVISGNNDYRTATVHEKASLETVDTSGLKDTDPQQDTDTQSATTATTPLNVHSSNLTNYDNAESVGSDLPRLSPLTFTSNHNTSSQNTDEEGHKQNFQKNLDDVTHLYKHLNTSADTNSHSNSNKHLNTSLDSRINLYKRLNTSPDSQTNHIHRLRDVGPQTSESGMEIYSNQNIQGTAPKSPNGGRIVPEGDVLQNEPEVVMQEDDIVTAANGQEMVTKGTPMANTLPSPVVVTQISSDKAGTPGLAVRPGVPVRPGSADDGSNTVATIIAPIAIGLVIVVLVLGFFVLHRRRRSTRLTRRSIWKKHGDTEWLAINSGGNIEAGMPEVSAQYSQPKDHIQDALTPLHRVPSERSWREDRCSVLYHDRRASIALQDVPAAEDTLFLDNDLYEDSTTLDSTLGDAASKDTIEESEEDYECPDDSSQQDNENPVGLANDINGGDPRPPLPPSPLSSDYHTSEEEDKSQPVVVEVYCTPLCQHDRHHHRCPSVSGSTNGYDPVYVPRHDADGMVRHLDNSNYVKGKPRSMSHVTNPYEEIAVEDEINGEAAQSSVTDDDLDVDIPYGAHNFLEGHDLAADPEPAAAQTESRTVRELDEAIPTVYGDIDPGNSSNVTPLVSSEAPPLPRRSPTHTKPRDINIRRHTAAFEPQTKSLSPPVLKPRGQSWTPKAVKRSDSNSSDYEAYDFSQMRK